MKMIKYSKEFFKKKFTADTMKNAYMNACKWYATNVLSKDELHNVLVEFVKEKNEQLPTVVIRLSATLSEDELRDRYCKICKETHSLFYMNHNYNCNKCEAKAYQVRTDDMLRVKLEYYRELLRKSVKEDFE